MWMQEFKDKPVIGIAEGAKVGSVHDLLLDSSGLQVAGFLVGGGGLLGGKRQAVTYDAVRGIGPDAVMVEGRDAVREIGDEGPLGEAQRQGDLHQEVMTESGVHLGTVDDLEFDPKTGAVTALLLDPKGNWTTDDGSGFIVERNDIVNLTPKMAIVRHEVMTGGRGATEPAGSIGHVVRGTERDMPTSEPSDRTADAPHERPADPALEHQPPEEERTVR